MPKENDRPQRSFEVLEWQISQWQLEYAPDDSVEQFCQVSAEIGEVAKALKHDNVHHLSASLGRSFIALMVLAQIEGLDPLTLLDDAWQSINLTKL